MRVRRHGTSAELFRVSLPPQRVLALPYKVQAVVQRHRADDKYDQTDIQCTHDCYGSALTLRAGHMHRAFRKIFSGIGMTLAAGSRQIRRVNHRARIRRSQNIVHAMTTAAICRGEFAGTQGQAVVTIRERRNARVAHAVLFDDARGGVTASACFLRDVLRRGRRGRHFRRLNGVLAVAIRADRSIVRAARQSCALHALRDLWRDALVAGAARL